MSERYVKAFPVYDWQTRGITRQIIDRKTGEKVGEATIASINPETQNEINDICEEARLRKANTPIKKLFGKI